MMRAVKSKEPLERLLLKISQLHHQAGQSKTEIAHQLGVSVTHVARLLSEAQRRGMVRVIITAPRFEDLDIELVNRFQLADAVVVASSEDEESLRFDLGNRAGRWFETNVPDGASVGIGSGRTLFEMIQSLPERPRKISIFPLTALAGRTLDTKSISSDTLANILWFKSRPIAEAHRMSISLPDSNPKEIEAHLSQLLTKPSVRSLRTSLNDLAFYFYSVSELRADSELAELAQINGKNLDDLKNLGIVGDYLFNTINSRGEHVPWGTEAMMLNLPLTSLQAASRDPLRRSVLVAGGLRKLDPINAGIHCKAFNVLITDDLTARRLLTNPV